MLAPASAIVFAVARPLEPSRERPLVVMSAVGMAAASTGSTVSAITTDVAAPAFGSVVPVYAVAAPTVVS